MLVRIHTYVPTGHFLKLEEGDYLQPSSTTPEILNVASHFVLRNEDSTARDGYESSRRTITQRLFFNYLLTIISAPNDATKSFANTV